MKYICTLRILIVVLTTFSISTKIISQNKEPLFLKSEQVMQLYESIIDEIEYYDAEAIAVRNKNKRVSWRKYKNFHKKQFKSIKSYSDLEDKFLAFGSGFVSAHSKFDFVYKKNEDERAKKEEANLKIGYTYPKISFFDLKSKKTIKKINGKSVRKVFSFFENFLTNRNLTITSQNNFKKKFENGELLIDKKQPYEIEFSDGTKAQIRYEIPDNSETLYQKYSKGLSLKNYPDWERVAVGYKASLLRKDNIALIKIKDFLYLKGRGGDISCKEIAADSTMCFDVLKIKKGLSKITNKVDYLIFDLQDNFGGSENTPFIKMFSPAPFYDLRVQYRKTKLLLNDSIRYYLNYNNERAENWYQKIKSNGILNRTIMGDFLPSRADFCNGEENCELKPIKPNDNITSHFKKIIVLVNEGTASSGDDFAHKMKEHKNVFIAGQPQFSDLTYSLIKVVYYLDINNKIQKKHVGNSQRNYEVPGNELLNFDIPYSKTVDANGKMLQGTPIKLDLDVALTKENFESRQKHVLDLAVKSLILEK